MTIDPVLAGHSKLFQTETAAKRLARPFEQILLSRSYAPPGSTAAK